MNQFTIAVVEDPTFLLTFPILGPAFGITKLDARDGNPKLVLHNALTVKL